MANYTWRSIRLDNIVRPYNCSPNTSFVWKQYRWHYPSIVYTNLLCNTSSSIKYYRMFWREQYGIREIVENCPKTVELGRSLTELQPIALPSQLQLMSSLGKKNCATAFGHHLRQLQWLNKQSARFVADDADIDTIETAEMDYRTSAVHLSKDKMKWIELY